MKELVINYSISTSYINDYEQFKLEVLDEKYDYFRGESQSDWQLNASFVRKLGASLQGYESKVIDFDLLEEAVKPYKALYDKRISPYHSFSRFLFYLQHSVSFSPFIDVTKDPWVALSFALENIQRNSDAMIREDAALYAIKLKGKKRENNHFLQNHTQIETVLKDLSIGINTLNPSKKTAEFYIIDSSDLNISNDRMQYQKGAFLLVNHYAKVKKEDQFKLPDDTEIDLHKFVISKDLMKELFFKLREEHPHYTIDYLYDPYRLFKTIKNT